ncbi:hypothetical protein TSAR_016770 [Trichomalopsis sarcophagae]|uniref:Uncharacterized protein n=1 Tax=Trichomalopsis sarcophagae TaxID=543379 RepID=A0A232EFB2_9HYME|nr:hypothetical protein TSAR_016770 [Trichomalopsis sarcophagae]
MVFAIDRVIVKLQRSELIKLKTSLYKGAADDTICLVLDIAVQYVIINCVTSIIAKKIIELDFLVTNIPTEVKESTNVWISSFLAKDTVSHSGTYAGTFAL